MRLYSDTLTGGDLQRAVPKGCNLELVSMERPRLRARGWNVRLTKPGGTHWTNTGTHGAGPDKAASWDDHGEWMATLYEQDAKMIVATYQDKSDFHKKTKNAYKEAS